jgi:hypothetical protein
LAHGKEQSERIITFLSVKNRTALTNLLFTYRILDIAAIVEGHPELTLPDRQSHNCRGDFKLNVSPLTCLLTLDIYHKGVDLGPVGKLAQITF